MVSLWGFCCFFFGWERGLPSDEGVRQRAVNLLRDPLDRLGASGPQTPQNSAKQCKRGQFYVAESQASCRAPKAKSTVENTPLSAGKVAPSALPPQPVLKATPPCHLRRKRARPCQRGIAAASHNPQPGEARCCECPLPLSSGTDMHDSLQSPNPTTTNHGTRRYIAVHTVDEP